MNWDTVLVAFMATIPPTVVAIASLVVAIKGNKQAIETHKSVNGMKHELVESVRKEAAATATLAEKGAQKEREGEAAVTEAERKRDAETIIR